MNPAYAPLFQTYTFNNGKTVKNRFVVAPMTHWSSDAHGHATPDELAYIKARSQGFGLFVTGSVAVSKQAISFTGQPLAINNDDLPSLKSVADTIKSGGALAIAQLQHGGAVVLPELNGGKILAPSSFKNKELETAYGKQLVTADGMSQDELVQTQNDFVNAAELAMKAGFDGVELHGANGYFLQQMFSAKTNQRDDEYGGSVENRIRFALELVDKIGKIKTKHSRDDFIIGYRITPEEAGDDGLTMADTLALVDGLVARNVQYIHLSLQDFHSKARRGADTNKSRLAIVKERLQNSDVALIGVGKLATPELALNAFNTGTADFVAIGLGALVNPNFVTLIEQGHENKAKKMFNLLRNGAYHQLPEPMWQNILNFVPKPVVQITNVIGKVLGWK